MKIVSIRLKNFNSLKGEHELDFTAEPLGSAGLFVITGPTGSGKSTILDAITLALYGRIPRIKQKIINHKLVEQEGIILTRHTDDCYTEVVYEVKGKRYRSSWTMSRNRNKKLNDRKQELFDVEADLILTDKNDDVITKNQEIIGLTYEQFVQSLILAQGKFAKLLQSGRTERNALLESITGTEIYREIGKLVYERSSQAQRSVEDHKERMKGIELLTEEEEEKFRLELVKNEPLRLDLEKTRAAIQSLINVKKEVVRLVKKQAENEQDFVAFTTEEGSLKTERLRLEKHDGVAVFRAEVDALDQEDVAIQKLNGNILLWNAEIEQLQKSIDESLIRAEKLVGESMLKDELIDRVMAFRKMIEGEQQRIENELTKLNQQEEIIQRHLAELTKDGLDLHFSDLTEERLHDELTLVSDRIQILNVTSLNTLIAKRDELRKAYQPATVLWSLRKETDRDAEDLRGKHDAIKQKADSLSAAQSRHLELTEELKKVLLEKEKAWKEFDKMKSERGLDALRNELVPGESCPLCGSLEHPYHEAYEEKLLSTYETLFLQANSAYDSLSNEYSRLEGTIASLASEIASDRKVLSAGEQDLERKKEKLKVDNIPFGWDLTAPILEWDELLNAMNTQIVALEDGEKDFNKKELLEKLRVDFLKVAPLQLNIRTATEQLQQKYSGKDIEKDVQHLLDDYRDKTLKLKDRLQLVEHSEKELKVKVKTQQDSRLSLESRMKGTGINDVSEYRKIILEESEAQKIRLRVNAIDARRVELTTMRTSLEVELQTQKEKDDVTKDEAALNQEFTALTEQINQLSEEIGKAREKLDRNEEDKAKLQDSMNVLNQLKKDQVLWGRMNDLIGEKTGNRFANFVQDLTFEQLIDFGNKRLLSFSDRYMLTMSSAFDTGDLQVMDTYMGNSVRSIFSLSGGETFKLSLALALGLSDLAARKVEIESLFIDEGFGSLDPDSLEEAISLLEDIQNKGNKSIGIISHVSELKDRIGTKVKLVPQGSGYSKIEVE